MSHPTEQPTALHDKKALRALLAADELDLVASHLHTLAERTGDGPLAQESTLLTARLEALRQSALAGDTDSDALTQTRNGIRRALLNLVEALPDVLPPSVKAARKSRPILTEGRFKILIFTMIALGKVIVAAWVAIHIDTGGFTREQGLSVLALLLPAFTAYVGAMLGDLMARRHDALPNAADQLPVRRSVRTITFIALPFYFLLLISLIGRYTAGHWEKNGESDFGALTAWLAIVEGSFGVYVGQIVQGVFGKRL